MKENHKYRTANTPLAAYLQIEGFNLKEVVAQPHQFRKGDFEAVYFFDDSEAIREAAKLWDTAQAGGNLNMFYHTYRSTVAKAKMVVKVALAPQGAGGEHGRHTKENNGKSSELVAPPAPTTRRRYVNDLHVTL